mgnify:CR=1 FL=1
MLILSLLSCLASAQEPPAPCPPPGYVLVRVDAEPSDAAREALEALERAQEALKAE